MSTQSGSEHRVVVDKIGGDWATLELQAGVTLDVPATWLPADAAEGQVLLAATRTNDRWSTLTLSIHDADTE